MLTKLRASLIVPLMTSSKIHTIVSHNEGTAQYLPLQQVTRRPHIQSRERVINIILHKKYEFMSVRCDFIQCHGEETIVSNVPSL